MHKISLSNTEISSPKTLNQGSALNSQQVPSGGKYPKTRQMVEIAKIICGEKYNPQITLLMLQAALEAELNISIEPAVPAQPAGPAGSNQNQL